MSGGRTSPARAALPATSSVRNALELEVPPGRHEIDRHSARLFAGAEDPARVGRCIVNRAALRAFHQAKGALEAPAAHDEGRIIEEKLLALRDACGVIERARYEGWGAFVPLIDEEDPYAADLKAIGYSHRVANTANALHRQIDKFLNELTLPTKPSLRNSRPLEAAFVRAIREGFEEQTGRRAPRSRSGPLVEFVRAAWRDVGFEQPDGIDEVLASMMERVA